MKTRLLIFLMFGCISVFGQKNVFHDPAFWEEKPSIERIKGEISKGNSATIAGPYDADAVVYAINAHSTMETIQFMLSQKGNDINKIVSNGRTYLYSAASNANIELMEYLISKGAKTNLRDNFGYTVLSYAAAIGQTNTRVYDICIREGADVVNEKVGGANALLLLAPYDKDFSLISYFINKGVDVKSTDSIGKTAFDYAVKGGHIEVLKALIAKGVKFNKDAILAASIGTYGSSGARLELYKYLVSLNLNPNVISVSGENVLHYIVRKPTQLDVINYFIEKGVEVNKANNEGITPLMYAASTNDDLATLTRLINLSKNLHQADKKGITALAYAVRRNTPEIVKLLIDKGADIKIVDSDGYNLAYYLIPTFAQNPKAFDVKLKLLEDKGFDIAATQKNGSSLYHLILVKNGLALLKRVERYNVDVNAKNKEGLTALHKAAMVAEDDTVLKYLVSIGAKKELITAFNETAYNLAKENEFLTKQHISIDFLK
ncbi:ankyrin repeat domain-containing protein [Pedobacter frigiditerrae]|uniref:Ankyrin repeat domain-containing protein n=1 Tax=Pedobacter frigiditerrae TaxID=2530452 RepID=A0A4R0MTG3_9SPHI|nr:ankyrin repeat domain-containing protein [Pedobacter frigiditerrae]TCC90320.1 ankyrin repeat domain-containing protein [Pedobacter frigiditerrae]